MQHWIRRGASALLLTAVFAGAAGLAPRPAAAFESRARHAGIFDIEQNCWLYGKSMEEVVPVASLTKLVSGLTFRRLGGDLDAPVTIEHADWYRAGRTRLRVGDTVPARTLLTMALASSDNCAARALSHVFGYDLQTFGYQMQRTVWELGCRQSRFVEPTGLDSLNTSNVRDVVLIFRAALEDPVLMEILGTPSYTIETRRGERTLVHSSRILRAREAVTAAKTGYLAVAGFCLVQRVQDPEGEFITVVLGAPTRGSRVRESLRLMDEARRQRQQLVRAD